MKFTNTITIERPPATVFAYLANLENLPQWNYALSETQQVTPGPPGVGTRYRQIRTIPVHTEESLEIIELAPNRKLTVQGTLSSLPAILTYTLDATDGTTALTNTVDIRPPRPLNLLAPIALSRVKSAVAANLAVLKQLLEQS
ncbi:SRPBCC family protein [Kribbella kalugense]|uniref:Polyketide cyclase/dehydrase/lipid transport protein n=1 Tax=Kribbella kalugense TaxID=2512221 RepID=A0A4R8A387_9ACTN|nr:SRPBCC family protein [Kribbella kalugense]TDW23878.1 polyketide cyclase/dehydrase/lipid transport protein [Kribbella kalugense]